MVEVSRENWEKYHRVRHHMSLGRKILSVTIVGSGGPKVVFKCTCKMCHKVYKSDEYQRTDICSPECGKKFLVMTCGNTWRGKKRPYHKRTPKHPLFGLKGEEYKKAFEQLSDTVDYSICTTQEIPLSEALTYKRVSQAIADGKEIIRVLKIQRGCGVVIQVIYKITCKICNQVETSENERLAAFGVCSHACAIISRSRGLKAAWDSGRMIGNTGQPAWNKDLKVDKEKYPNWGREWIKFLTEEEFAERMHRLQYPLRRWIEVAGKKYHVRSEFEEGFIRYLDRCAIVFTYEPRMILLSDGRHKYLPDYYLPDFNMYIDTKSYTRMLKVDNLTPEQIEEWIRERVEATNKISATLEIVWYEEFFKNPELSLPKSLQEYVGRKVQRSEIEDSDSNNISVDGVIYQLPRSARQPEMVDDMIQTVS